MKVVLYAAGKEVLSLIFNGVGTTKNDWFDRARLEEHPWTDGNLFGSAIKFSVQGVNYL